MMSLPSDLPNQTFVNVYALVVGTFLLADTEIFEDAIEAKSAHKRRLPSLSFLIEHPTYGRFLFDLGLKKDGKGYPPQLQKEIEDEGYELEVPKDIVDLLKEGNVDARDVAGVIWSHLHFDHIGDLTPFSKSGCLVVGVEARELVEETGYPANPDSRWASIPDSQRVVYVDFSASYIESGTLPWLYASDAQILIQVVGSYLKAVDLFADGSFYLLDAPGHFPGHLNALARVSPNTFILLAADSCHHRLCYDPGERLVSRNNHDDIKVARETVKIIKEMNQKREVVVVLAHEQERLDEGMPVFPKRLNEWVMEEKVAKSSGPSVGV